MKRQYTAKEFEEQVFALDSINPYALIGTDVIVGFLDETDRDFDRTYRLLEKVPVAKFHVFRFSKKKGTAGYYMAKNQKEPSDAVKRRRSAALIALGKEKYKLFQDKLIGNTFSCLLLRKIDKDYYEGLLSNQVPVVVNIGKPLS